MWCRVVRWELPTLLTQRVHSSSGSNGPKRTAMQKHSVYILPISGCRKYRSCGVVVVVVVTGMQWDISCNPFCTMTPVIRPRPHPVQFTTIPIRSAAKLSVLQPDLSYTPYLSAWLFFKDSLKLTKYLPNNTVTSQKTWIFQNRFCYDFPIKKKIWTYWETNQWSWSHWPLFTNNRL